MLLTDAAAMRPNFDVALLSALRGGARLIQLREKTLSPREVLALAHRAQKLCEVYGAQLLINSRADIARAAHVAGVHLPENDLSPRDIRLTLGEHALCGVSVHSPASARRALEEGADYLIFGPIFPTASHPESSGEGIEKLREIVQMSSRPVFAIGGIEANSARLCIEAGAHGVAVLSAAWREANIEATIKELIAQIEIEMM